MNIVDKVLTLLAVISFCMLIGSLFYGFILAFLGKFYPEVRLMVIIAAFLLSFSVILLK